MIRINRTLYKKTAFVLAAATVFTSIPTCVFAEPSNTEISLEKSSGKFSENAKKNESDVEEKIDISQMTEIRIGSLEEYNALAKNCRLDTWSRDKYVVLTSDIDCTGKDISQIPTFAGVFEGNNHAIINAAFTEKECYSGLFSKTMSTAVIRNINLLGVTKPGGKTFDAGGLVGDNFGMISNCSFEGYLEGYDYVGAIAGYNEAGAVISSCDVKGTISGRHYVGGIAGANAGLITGCTSNADINTVNKEVETAIGDIKVEQILTSIITNVTKDEGNNKDVNNSQNPIDIGGIVGFNYGEVSSSSSSSTVGYEHVGYNIGGIAGRQTGYIHDCSNEGTVYGRKDLGGIVGQAEPYIRLDLTQDVITQLTDNINKLHDALNKTIHDSNDSSDVVSARLNVIKEFTDKALSDTGYLANGTQDFINGVVSTTNEASNRIQYVISEVSKDDGAMAEVEDAGKNIRNAAEDLEEFVDDLDIYSHLSSEEARSYDNAKNGLKNSTDEYRRYMGDYKNTAEYQEAKDLAYTKAIADLWDAKYEEVRQQHWNDKYNEEIANGHTASEAKALADAYIDDTTVGPPTVNQMATTEADSYILTQDAKDKAEAIATADAMTGSASYADAQYTKNHPGHSYTSDLGDDADIIATTIIGNVDEMVEDSIDDAGEALDDAKKMAQNLKNAAGDFKSTMKNVADKGTLQFPQLSDEYRGHTNSLVANLQGMSDNLGFLNNEMNGSTDVVCADMEQVNDQFNTIMLLFTDAMDGALDMDYSDIYEDESNDVCEDSVDATITKCRNSGRIEGDINCGGIAGTMAQEYDFDLEGDVTGVSDASRNSTYRTKCVLRDDVNKGVVKGQKSYAGGVVGLHEVGTILRCENYAKVSSASGDYVGGIAGQSFATIRNSKAKCLLFGATYVGGITGSGVDIMECVAMPTVLESSYFVGAIAGVQDKDGKLHNNIFVSDELAGIDRISISGGAEPVEYSQLLQMEGIPSEFSKANVYFVVDDDVVETVSKKVGDTVSASDFTAVDKLDLDDDEYVSWDIDEETVAGEMEITGEYIRYRSTLASDIARDGGQSVILVDGCFRTEDQIVVIRTVEKVVDGFLSEEYSIEIPDDGLVNHKIRYKMPEEVETINLFVKESGEFKQVEFEQYGKYTVFTAPGNNVEIRVSEIMDPEKLFDIIIAVAIGIVLIIIVIIVLVVKRVKKHRRSVKKTGKAKNTGKELEVSEIDEEQSDENEAGDNAGRIYKQNERADG